jgi:ubiquinone/menaquinone biosynthesis C-methylase UbiE
MTIDSSSSDEGAPGLWDAMVAEDAEYFGEDILDPEARKRWCGAVLFGGLPYLWNNSALVPRKLAVDHLDLSPGDRVLIVGEAVADIGFDSELEELVGADGTVDVIDMRAEVLELFGAGKEPKWEWQFTRDTADEHYDAIFVGQGVAHAGDWRREGAELLRVLKSGRPLVLAEISFADNFYARVAADVHLEYWVRKLMEGVAHDFRGLPYWNLETVAESLADQLDGLETFEWRGVDLLWGRKP